MPLWRVTAEAPPWTIERAAQIVEEGSSPPLSVSMFEASKTNWSLDLLYTEERDLAALRAELAAADPVLTGLEFHQGPLPEEDWVAKSLGELKPIEAGHFFVYGSHDASRIPPGKIPILIEAGEAFGTGHHGTTAGCLEALSRIDRDFHPSRILDLGTGSGILAIAAARLWHEQVLATDIDPVAVRVASENVRLNGVQAHVQTLAATGTNHPKIHAAAPFDLIVANILARPLRRLAGDVAPLLARGGLVVLSGLLKEQAPRVEGIYASHHMPTQARLTYGEWVTLICKKS